MVWKHLWSLPKILSTHSTFSRSNPEASTFSDSSKPRQSRGYFNLQRTAFPNLMCHEGLFPQTCLSSLLHPPPPPCSPLRQVPSLASSSSSFQWKLQPSPQEELLSPQTLAPQPSARSPHSLVLKQGGRMGKWEGGAWLSRRACCWHRVPQGQEH